MWPSEPTPGETYPSALPLRLRQRDELGERFHPERGMRGDHDRRAADIGDMGEVLHRIERWVGAGRRGDNVGRDSGDHEGGAVGIGMGNRGGTDHAARARPVLDDDALRERVAEMLGQDAADHVGASSGRPRHDDAHGLCSARVCGDGGGDACAVLRTVGATAEPVSAPMIASRSQQPMHVSPP